ncbi:polysaccharide deacetylase family protein [Candidatus Marimicrobium litorale]|nr:polysaccharide deacetylase family protein [Candidatus Marimicrobium litorale]
MRHAAFSLLARMLPLALGTRGKQRLSILIYHRVVTEFDPMRPAEPTREIFDWQMRLVRQHFHPLSLLEALDKLESGQLPERAICVTFDDGYADNELHAMPILKKYAVPATVFVSPGFLNGGRMWNDSLIEFFRCFRGDSLDLNELGLGRHDTANMDARLASAERVIGEIKYRDPAERVQLVEQIQDWFEGEGRPDDLMMTDAQVRSLASNGISIGAHTVNHPILASVTDEVAHREIQDSKARLEDMLQQSVDVFAYPNGQPGQDYRKEHVAMVKSLGFRAAVSTHWGVSDRENDCYQLPRFTPWDKQPSRFAGRLLLNYREIGVPGL